MEEVKYPIKYAIIRVDEGKLGDSSAAECFYSTEAFIVSKCYLVGKKTRYFRKGRVQTSYDVTFPIDLYDLGEPENWKRSTPDCNFKGEFINAHSTEQVFNTLEEAQQYSRELNEKLLHEKIKLFKASKTYSTTGEMVAGIKEEHARCLKYWKSIEKKLLQHTADMVVFPTTFESLLAKVVERPAEFYQRLAETLSKEEREYMKMFLQDKSCMNCTNVSCRVESSEKIGLDEEGKAQGSECATWENKELIGRLLLKMKA